MCRRVRPRVFALACRSVLLWGALAVCTGPTAASADEQQPGAKQPRGKDVFGLTKVWAFDLEIPAKEYEAMQPPAGGFGAFGGPQTPPAPRNPNDRRESERNLFGTEFPWAQGNLST